MIEKGIALQKTPERNKIQNDYRVAIKLIYSRRKEKYP
jgi:hypothetical protein